jgi:hypothetical protein
MAVVPIPVSKINIQLNTNIGEKPELFKRSMIKLPKLDEAPNVNSDVPYFTKYVKYPGWIQSGTWKERMEFFFNREVFTKTLRDALISRGTSPITIDGTDENYKIAHKIEKHNIMVMLRSLFPIPEQFGQALKSSYDHILRQHQNSRVITDVSFKQAINVFGLMYRIGVLQKEREESFLILGGKEYDVEDVVWENDIVNHPLYYNFLVLRRKLRDKIEETKSEVLKKYANYEKAIDAELENSHAVDAVKTDVIYLIQSGNLNFSKVDNSQKTNDILKNKPAEDITAIFENKINRNRNYGIYRDAAVLFGLNQRPEDKPAYDAKVAEAVKVIKNQDTMQSLLWNMEINVPDSTGPGGLEFDKIRDRIAVKNRIKAKLESLINGSLKGDDAAKILISVKNDLDEHNASRGERSTVFINGDYEKYFDKILKLAVQMRSAGMVKDFVDSRRAMNLTDKKIADGSDETPIVKRLNKFIRDTFPTQSKMNNDQITTVAQIYEPARRTYNTKLYNLLFKLKTGENPPGLTDDEVQTHMLDEIYNAYAASLDAKFPSQTNPDLKPYLYVGVEEVKPSSSSDKDKSEMDVQGNVMEIYLWINLVDAKKMDTVPKASCKLYDKMLEQELREITDLRHRDRMLSRYRNLDFDSVVNDPIKEAIKEQVEKKNGGTKRLRPASKRTTIRTYSA